VVDSERLAMEAIVVKSGALIDWSAANAVPDVV
jgi:hypothetical protein